MAFASRALTFLLSVTVGGASCGVPAGALCAALCATTGGALGAAETPPPESASPFEFSSNGPASWSLDPTQPSTASGGVAAIYEGILLQADHLSFLQSPVPGVAGSIPADGDLLPGDQGPAGGRVMLDTRKATLPTIGFKGLLLPSAVTIRRLPADPARPAIVDYQVTLPDTGPFEGQLNTKNGWTPVRGWSERTELIIEGDTRTGALANLRVARIVLNGRPAVGDVPRRNAEISRIKAGATVPALTEPLPDDAMAGHVDGAQIIIAFDELGRPSASWPNGTVKGDINFLNMRDVSDSPKPKPKPAP